LKTLKSYLLIVLTAIFLNFNVGCVAVNVKPQIEIPERPALPIPAERPEIQGVVVDGKNGEKAILLKLEDAIRLRDYILQLEESILLLDGYIEKLINRLKAVSE
jgi:hypothetical protein